MLFKLQSVVKSAHQLPIGTELPRVERDDINVENLGLHLDELRALLAQLRFTMAAAQMEDYMEHVSQCPQCQRELGCKGHHEIVYRTVFGTLHLDSPRLYHYPACHKS